tara:strand:- start:3195 stop:4466 length:1272 start_codon:yes stop_codon:yes gene_type:complete
MAGEWAAVPLSELTSTPPTYGVVQPGQDTASGSPMLRVNNFQGHSLNLSEVMRIAPEIEAKYGRTRIQTGDVLLTIVGSVGQVAVVPYELSGWNIARAIAMIRPNKPELSRWISLVLRSPQAQYQLGVAANTTVQTTINLKDLRELRIPLPDDGERDAIAHILGTLDDKIELNRRRNQTLEAMARALFKDWFVDFGPVRAKMECQEPYLPADLWQLFPDRLDDEGKPDGWELRSVGDCFRLTMGQSPPGDTYNDTGDGLPFFQGRTDFGFRYPDNRKYCSTPMRTANAEDTLVSVRAPVGDINLAWEKCCVGRGVASVRHFSGARSFTYHAVWSLQEELRQYEHTGTVFGAINKKQFEAIGFIDPRGELIESFENKASPMDDEIRNNTEESRTLAQLRDTLLPKLISGELRVKDADRFIERAG